MLDSRMWKRINALEMATDFIVGILPVRSRIQDKKRTEIAPVFVTSFDGDRHKSGRSV